MFALMLNFSREMVLRTRFLLTLNLGRHVSLEQA